MVKHKHINVFTYIVASAIVFGIALLLGHIFQNEIKPENIYSKIQRIIDRKEAQLKDHTKMIKEELRHSPDSLFENLAHLSGKYAKDGFVCMILNDESLVYWSDNSISLDFINRNDLSGVVNTGNAFLRVNRTDLDSYTIIDGYIIRYDYPYVNDYLENSFHRSFHLNCNPKVSLNGGNHNITGSDGQFLFSVTLSASDTMGNSRTFILLFLYSLSILLFLRFIYELHYIFYRRNGLHFLFIGGYIFDLVLIRVLLYLFRVPRILYESDIFSPKYYAYSDFIPSLGDLFLTTLFIVVISFFLFRQIKFNLKYLKRKAFYKQFIIFTLFVHVFIFFKGVTFLFKSIIVDSNISLDLNHIFTLSGMSIISFLILTGILLSYFLITSKLIFFAYQYSMGFANFIGQLLVVFVLFSTLCFAGAHCDFYYLLFVFFYVLSFWFFFRYRNYKLSLSNIVFYLLFFSLVSTYALHQNNDLKEKEYRKLLAVKLSSDQRDPLTEYLFTKVYQNISNDPKVEHYLKAYLRNEVNQDSLNTYLTERYFSGFWKKYIAQITVCSPDEYLLIRPENIEMNCFDYFDTIIVQNSVEIPDSRLFYINYSPVESGYLSVLVFDITSQNVHIPVKIYIEFMPKYAGRNLGFPDLLVDNKIDKSPDLSDYSYAKYEGKVLYKRVGKYFYNINLSHYGHFNRQFVFFNKNGYNHLYYRIDDHQDLLISKKQKTVMDILAPFSYLFLAYGTFILLIFFLFILPVSHRTMHLNYRTRLQIAMFSIILFSFVVIGVFTMYYINNLNEQKNRDILSEKTHSVLVELQQKLATQQSLNHLRDYTENLLVKFSAVFFTDINLFDLSGDLISSSRQQIFNEKLISRRMNPNAFYQLTVNNSSLYIHNETIGKQNYLSAYIPFINNQNRVIAYLNLPYFAKENDLKREISSFLVAYINIYVILMALSILLALVISNYISRPIKLIMTKIREVRLLGQNEKIVWNRNDEIGKLVNEYNRMIDELARSAELLARSERESAWREMARQVAHEIKNPLTPMKLSVQYLEQSWNRHSPDWDKRLAKFTQTMIEQIDTLSAIAGEFSDFAKMPVTKKENTNLVEVIQNAISLFRNYDNVHITFSKPSFSDFFVFADKEQLLRAFNNLLKNSIQAIGTRPDGKIEITVEHSGTNCKIEITDNGGGIPAELRNKIFSPNFTTKSGGMGLGLAIVRSIIVNSGGEISFRSVEGEGTTFVILLPLVG
jgi:signal transduction histidine kinase